MEQRSSPAGEGLCRHQRLRQRSDYVRCYRQGRKRHGSLVSIHSHSNEVQDVRLGITASRRVGNSVVRHRLKRRVREIFRLFERRDSLRPMDIVVHLKPSAANTDFAALANELERLLRALLPCSERER